MNIAEIERLGKACDRAAEMLYAPKVLVLDEMQDAIVAAYRAGCWDTARKQGYGLLGAFLVGVGLGGVLAWAALGL